MSARGCWSGKRYALCKRSAASLAAHAQHRRHDMLKICGEVCPLFKCFRRSEQTNYESSRKSALRTYRSNSRLILMMNERRSRVASVAFAVSCWLLYTTKKPVPLRLIHAKRMFDENVAA